MQIRRRHQTRCGSARSGGFWDDRQESSSCCGRRFRLEETQEGSRRPQGHQQARALGGDAGLARSRMFLRRSQRRPTRQLKLCGGACPVEERGGLSGHQGHQQARQLGGVDSGLARARGQLTPQPAPTSPANAISAVFRRSRCSTSVPRHVALVRVSWVRHELRADRRYSHPRRDGDAPLGQ
jgi:hypothetical protein